MSTFLALQAIDLIEIHSSPVTLSCCCTSLLFGLDPVVPFVKTHWVLSGFHQVYLSAYHHLKTEQEVNEAEDVEEIVEDVHFFFNHLLVELSGLTV